MRLEGRPVTPGVASSSPVRSADSGPPPASARASTPAAARSPCSAGCRPYSERRVPRHPTGCGAREGRRRAKARWVPSAARLRLVRPAPRRGRAADAGHLPRAAEPAGLRAHRRHLRPPARAESGPRPRPAADPRLGHEAAARTPSRGRDAGVPAGREAVSGTLRFPVRRPGPGVRGERDAAIANYKQALALEPGQTHARERLGALGVQ